jgi:hypothetical protein
LDEVLNWLNAELESIGVPYEFLEWTQPVSYPYFVGEYTEFEPMLESGEQDKTFIITGFCRGKNARLKLEEIRAKIETAFPAVEGKTAILDSGSGLAVFYANAFPVSTGEAEFYKMQVNLNVKLWKVMNNG